MVQHHCSGASECISRAGTFQSVTLVDELTDSTAAGEKTHVR